MKEMRNCTDTYIYPTKQQTKGTCKPLCKLPSKKRSGQRTGKVKTEIYTEDLSGYTIELPSSLPSPSTHKIYNKHLRKK